MPKTTSAIEKRIKKEELRLAALYQDIRADKKQLIEGLIQRAAFMRVTLEDLEKQLNAEGLTELFTQSEKTDPYEREKPAARLYVAINDKYQKIITQLNSNLPKELRLNDDIL